MTLPAFPEMPCPTLYANEAKIYFDGVVVRLDWLLMQPSGAQVEKNDLVLPVARIAIPPKLAVRLREQLTQLEGSVRAQAILPTAVPAPGTPQ